MDTRIEAAAKALFTHKPTLTGGWLTWDHLSEKGKDVYRETARVAIEAADAQEERIEEQRALNDFANEQCGDYPAPCNCDDSVTHNGH